MEKTQQVSVPTISTGSPANCCPDRYVKGEPVTSVMLTPKAIATMTKDYRTPEDTVEVWAGRAYLPSLNKCINDLGRTRVENALKLYLIQLNMATNPARPLNEEIIDTMVPPILDHIIEDLNTSITTADLRIVFDRAMRGFYGKMYGGFGCQDVCDWFSQYDVEKMEAIDRYEERRKQGDYCGSRSESFDAARFHEIYVDYINGRI